jgi:hypothetical protein
MSSQEKLDALERMGKVPKEVCWHPLRKQFLDSLNRNKVIKEAKK